MLNLAPGEQTYEEIVKTRDQVFARYRPVFSLDHVPTISREEFTSFLYSENNHHWSGLYRKGLQAAEDMDALRRALTLLLDESKPMQQRFTGALDMVKGLGKATATGILTVAHPESYGVWNNTSEAALRNLGLWPTSERGEKSGATYTKVNALLARLRNDLETDFWTLDAYGGTSPPLVALRLHSVMLVCQSLKHRVVLEARSPSKNSSRTSSWKIGSIRH